MRTLAVIPARLGATRLPRKPLRLLAGLPIVVRVWRHVAAMDVAERTVVATDSEEVAAIVRGHGGHVVLTAPEHPSGTDRVAEVAALQEYRAFDVILNIQGDEPFIAEGAVSGAWAMVNSNGFELGTAANTADMGVLTKPDIVKVVAADDGRAMYFSRAAIPFLRDVEDAPLLAGRVWQHIGVYAYTHDALARWVALPTHPLERIERLEQLRPLTAGMSMGVALVDEPMRGGIDTEDDLERANAAWTPLTPGQH